MGKKKKSQSPDAVLARAEEMFNRGNYLLALREYEKAASMLKEPGDLAEKIGICNRKMAEAKAEELVKKARKYAGKGDVRAALRSFEEAYAITEEEWIGQKVAEMKNAALSEDLSADAKRAEAAEDFEKAAELYAEICARETGDDLREKWARCLVKAKKYKEAVAIFQDANFSNTGALYDWGFALAGTGEYYRCLQVWDKISSMDKGFAKQKETVRELLACDLLAEYENGGDSSAIYEQGHYLLQTGELPEPVKEAVKACGYAWIQKLWQDEQYEKMMSVLDAWPFEMEPSLLQVLAKGSFNLAESSGTRLNDLAVYWLPAVYAAQAKNGRSALNDGVWLREELIRRAESLLKQPQGAEGSSAGADLACWNVERKLLEDLCGLADGRKKNLHYFICTPRLAARYDISQAIVDLIRSKRKRFPDLERYLNAGAFYSAAGEALYLLEEGNYEKALQSLSENPGDDEFSLWAIRRVTFAAGVQAMNRGENPPRGFADMATELINQVHHFSRELVDGALKAEDQRILSRYEESLAAMRAIKPRKDLDQALSYVMSRRALKMYNRNLINDKIMANSLRDALSLYPENEHARGLLADTRKDLESIELNKALDAHKMGRACRIALETEHQEVREEFFEYFEEMLDHLEEAVVDVSDRIYSLQKVYNWCARVDDEHEILDDIVEMIEEAKEASGK